ncbi:helix-turn-helix transcriptional regulator [Amylibacter sp. SFDW26]|uniref:winged helix-turn-helix transcriptional regulator n=1 Tax=Amylibacter sp. SFDW26 TaxID=2652722 RepID=UPI0012616113|nr:helix-turn-helix domain-containing protein [Amylibacter sp. SFDW26]KAB7616212.1 helix-turn-helix transcriptional regulator [Amylibacter sp. SFDW26]
MRKQRHPTEILEHCPMEATLDLIGGKWKGVILFRLYEGTKRFNELSRLICTISPRTLTKQLRELEADGLISRTVYPVVPPKVEYNLTERGQTLQPVLLALMEWGQTNILDATPIEQSNSL